MNRTGLLTLLVALLLWGSATWVESGARGDAVVGEELWYYPSGKFVKEASLGYEQAAAALAWIQTVQYYGKHIKTDREFSMMHHLCDTVTDLDPKFEAPYVFGAFVLFTDAGRPQEGLKLLEKGRLAHPESWRIWFESGFVYYVALGDYRRAAVFFKRAAGLPGAPSHAASFAAYMAEKAGSLEAALVLWAEFAQRTENPALRERAEENITEIQRLIAERGAEP